MNILIHTCPKRLWYVKGWIIPSLAAQGLDGIRIYNDTKGEGNLMSCMKSFRECGKRSGGTWHLQDDVIVSDDFAKVAADHDDGIVCGFVHQNFGIGTAAVGRSPVNLMWYSFPCIRIPNELAGECAEWFFSDAMKRPENASRVSLRRYDDWFWLQFMRERHPDGWVYHLKPNIVDHVDYLLGGSTLTGAQPNKRGAMYFDDQGEEERLKQYLAKKAR